MYAGRVACCPIVSHESRWVCAARSIKVRKKTGQADRQMDGRRLHDYSARCGLRKKYAHSNRPLTPAKRWIIVCVCTQNPSRVAGKEMFRMSWCPNVVSLAWLIVTVIVTSLPQATTTPRSNDKGYRLPTFQFVISWLINNYVYVRLNN